MAQSGDGRYVTAVVALLVVSSIATVRAQADDRPLAGVRFERFDSAAGPSHNSVYAILQDTQGFLWFGTADGLNRYDGYEFVVHRFDPDDDTSLRNNTVYALLEDQAGRFWMGTEAGLDRLDRVTDRFIHYDLDDPSARLLSRRVMTVFEARDGTLLTGHETLVRYDPEIDTFVPVTGWPESTTPGDRQVVGIQQDSTGAIWVLTRQVSALRFDLLELGFASSGDVSVVATHPIDQAPEQQAFGFLIDSTDRFWIDASGPLRRDESGFVRPSRQGVTTAWALHEARDGTVRVGSLGEGVYDAPLDGDVRESLRLGPGFLENYIRSIFEDTAGSIWIGTHAGLFRHDPSAAPIVTLTHDPADPDTLSNDAVSSIVEDRSGQLWVGTYGGGLNLLDRTRRRVTRFRHDPSRPTSLPDDVIRSLHLDDRGTLWIATDSGLVSYEPSADRFARHPLPEIPGSQGLPAVAHIAGDRAGHLFLASQMGLYRYDIGAGEASVFPVSDDDRGPGARDLQGLLVDEGGHVWIGAGGVSLDRLDPSTGRFEHSPLVTTSGEPIAAEGIWQIVTGKTGTLWLATGSGLIHFDPSDRSFRRYSTENGLPGSLVYSMAEDGSGRLWVGTNRGLARFDPDDPSSSFQTLRTSTLRGMEFNRHAVLRTRSGELLFGSVDGLVIVQPELVRTDSHVPPIVLTDIERSTRDGAFRVEPFALDRLTLSPNDAAFSFEFAALSYTSPEHNRYAYYLDGFDPDWVQSGSRHFARYANVPPGQYVFRVIGSNSDGVWNETGVSLPVTVTPPYWQTWWFRALVATLIVGLGVAAYRYRIARLLEMQRLRLRIAGDLHDDLSSDLSGVAMLTEMVARRPHLRDRDRRELTEVERTTRHMIDALRDIVWYINPEQDTLPAMVQRMRSTAAKLLGNVEYRFEAPDLGRGERLDMAVRRHLYLLFKEALHNIARHAKAQHVDIVLAKAEEEWRLVIHDDGVGFDPGLEHEGHGMASMKRRAEQMGGSLDIESVTDLGTTVTIAIRMASSRDGRSA